MAKFTKIGYGFIHESRKGNKSINLVLDPKAKKQLMEHDWERGIFIFKSKKTKNDKPFYNILVSMPDDYEYSPGTSFIEKKEKYQADNLNQKHNTGFQSVGEVIREKLESKNLNTGPAGAVKYTDKELKKVFG